MSNARGDSMDDSQRSRALPKDRPVPRRRSSSDADPNAVETAKQDIAAPPSIPTSITIATVGLRSLAIANDSPIIDGRPRRRHSIPPSRQERRDSPDTFRVAATYFNLANLHFARQNLDSALQYYTEAVRIEHSGMRERPTTMMALLNVAQIHRSRRDFVLALGAYEQLKAIQLSLYGPFSLVVARTWSFMGQVYHERGHLVAALESLQLALDVQRQYHQADGLVHTAADLAATIYSMGLVWFDLTQYDLANISFTESLQLKLTVVGPNHHDIAVLWYNIGRVYRSKGDETNAIVFYKAAWRVTRSLHGLGDMYHHWAVQLLQQIGMAFQSTGDLAEALEFFSHALQLEREYQQRQQEQSGPLSPAVRQSALVVARLLNVVGNIHLQLAEVAQMMECYAEATRMYQSLNADGPIERNDDGTNESSQGLVIAGYNYYAQNRLHPASAPAA